MDDPIWISVDLAIAIHKRQLAEHGGADGVRDMGLLESALGRPRRERQKPPQQEEELQQVETKR